MKYIFAFWRSSQKPYYTNVSDVPRSLQKLSFNHSNGRTHSRRFSTFYKNVLSQTHYLVINTRSTRYYVDWESTAFLFCLACWSASQLSNSRTLVVHGVDWFLISISKTRTVLCLRIRTSTLITLYGSNIKRSNKTWTSLRTRTRLAACSLQQYHDTWYMIQNRV